MAIAKKDREAARLLKLIASSTRLRILRLLSQHRKLFVCEIAERLEMSHSAISHQLAALRSADLVETASHGRMASYSLTGNLKSRAVGAILAIV